MISKKFSESHFFKGLEFLFGPKTFFSLRGSRFLKWRFKLNRPVLAELFLAVAIFLTFYKGFLANVISLNLSLLVPVLMLLALILADKSKLIFNKATLWLGMLLVVLMMSGLWAIIGGANPVVILLGLLIYLQFILAFLVGQGLGFEKVKVAVVALSLPAGIYGIWQYLSGSANSRIWFSSFENLNATRAFAWFGSPNVLGILMAFVAVLSIFELMAKRKFVYGLATFISLFALFATFSRSAWLGFALGLAIALVVLNYRYIFLAPLALLVFISGSVRNRVLALLNPQYVFDASLDGRLWAAQNGAHICLKSPVIGFGPGSYGGKIAQNYASPVYLLGMQNGYTPLYFTDNQWLEVLVQGGVLALLAFIGFIGSAFWQIIAVFKVKKDISILGALGVLVVFTFSGLAANVLEFGAVAIPAALIIGSVLNEA